MKINTGQFEPEKGGQVEADLPGQVEPEFSGQVKTDCMVNAFGKKVVKSTGLSNEVGKIVLNTELRASSTIISTTQLLSGYYVYKFYLENAPVIAGKLIIIK